MMIRFSTSLLLACCATSLSTMVDAEPFRYKLHFRDKLDKQWIHAEYSSVSLIQCGSLSFKDPVNYKYFGYNGKICTLLKDTVDPDSCSSDDCTAAGIKIYKLREEVTTTTKPTTTTTVPPTTTAAPTTTTMPPTTTTTQPTTTVTTTTEKTTTTEATTTTTKSTTIPTTTTETPTTTTKTPTTTAQTTAAPTTTTPTTTTEPTTTTTTEEPTTTTTKATTTTIPTTTEAPTTTTQPTTTKETTVATTTTEGPRSTTEMPNTCEEAGGTALEVQCGMKTHIMHGFGSRSPFFRDVTSAVCDDWGDIFESESEKRKFLSPNGITVHTHCGENSIISSFEVCVKNLTVFGVYLNCNKMKDPEKYIIDQNAGGESSGSHQDVDCGRKTALNMMNFLDAGKTIVQVVLKCVNLDVSDPIPEVDPPAPGRK